MSEPFAYESYALTNCAITLSYFQIFVESLLCSSDMKNILLAGEMMERNAVEGQEPDYNIPNSDIGLVTEKVQYKIAIQLVLQAAREYFDSSTNLTDVSMDLARYVHLVCQIFVRPKFGHSFLL